MQKYHAVELVRVSSVNFANLYFTQSTMRSTPLTALNI